LSARGVNGGSQFNKCVGDSLYQGIISFSAGPGNWITTNYATTACCLKNQCFSFPCPYSPVDITFQCTRVGQSTFCVTNGYSETGTFGNLCGGILGDVSVVNASSTGLTNCPSLDIVANALVTGPTTGPAFTWLCCNNGIHSC